MGTNSTSIPAVSELTETGSVIVHSSVDNTPIVRDNEMDTDDDSVNSLNDEDIAVKVTSFQNKNKPRLSFIPTLMPEMDQSMTSPTRVLINKSMTRSISPEESYMTPNGGAAVCTYSPVKNKGNIGFNKSIPIYDPSQLFGIVSEY